MMMIRILGLRCGVRCAFDTQSGKAAELAPRAESKTPPTGNKAGGGPTRDEAFKRESVAFLHSDDESSANGPGGDKDAPSTIDEVKATMKIVISILITTMMMMTVRTTY
jgi:hypothetical protein